MLTNETGSLWSCQLKLQGKIIPGSNPKFDTSWLLFKLLFIYSFIWGSYKRRGGATTLLQKKHGWSTYIEIKSSRSNASFSVRAVESPQFLSLKRAPYSPATLIWDETLETLTRLAGICSKVTATAPTAACSFKL